MRWRALQCARLAHRHGAVSAVREWAGAVPRLGYRNSETYKDKGEQRGRAEQQRPSTNGSQVCVLPHSVFLRPHTSPQARAYRRRQHIPLLGRRASGGVRTRTGSEAERGSAQDVVLGHLDLLQAEQAHHLAQDHRPGDDRRRTRGIEAGCLLALLERG